MCLLTISRLMTGEVADLARYAESVSSQFQTLIGVPKKRIDALQAKLSDLRHRKAAVQARTIGLMRELADFEQAEKDNATKKQAPLTEEECSKFLPVLSALTLSTVERAAEHQQRWVVRVGKLQCEPDLIEKNWELVSQALQRIN